MLYRHEKLCFQRKQTSVELPLLQPYCISNAFPLDGFASTIQMYSWLCPWLLTWSDYEEDYKEDDGGNDDAGAN
jgi:hypothetical protein